ncbi:MAG: septum formation initiator family protein [Lachnospiraceae bacterium]|nr:septum formation initiator family protein [Lachnospiraceae bacterium]
MFSVLIIVVSICGVLLYQMKDLNAKDKELEKTQSELKQQLEDEKERSEYLEEQRIYVQTKKYVEEVAKKLGYVYPDEIIFKPYED